MGISVIKKFRPVGATDIVTDEFEIDDPIDLMRDTIPDQYVLWVGLPHDHDLIANDVRDAMNNEDKKAVCTCSPLGLRAPDFNQPAKIFSHMDKMMHVDSAHGGFHECGKFDYNLFHMTKFAAELSAGTNMTEVDGIRTTPDGKMEMHKYQVANLMGYVNIVSANRSWRKVVSWLPGAFIQQSPTLIYGSTLLTYMGDPRWFVTPQMGRKPDTRYLLRYFGISSLKESIECRENSPKMFRSLAVINTWWWLPDKLTPEDAAKEANGYFHRVFTRHYKNLLERHPQPVANSTAVLYTSMHFLNLLWLVTLETVAPEFKFDAARFFGSDTDSRESFLEHYNSG